MNPRKLLLARLFEAAGLNSGLLRLQSALWRPHVRALNYHDVPAALAGAFESQLEQLLRRYVAVGRAELEDLLAGRWRHERPGILLSFDDGVRSHAEVVAPLLEAHGAVGWFFVPAAFPDVPAASQPDWAREHHIIPAAPGPDGRVAMTWDEIRRLDRQHVVGCHTMHHRRLGATVGAAELKAEVAGAKAHLEERLGREVPVFSWVGGEEWSYSAAAAAAIRGAGFRLSFMTNNAVVRPGSDPLQLQRTNLEAAFPPFLARFQISGALDLIYLPKRRRVTALTAAPAEA